jgi:hypothetical protein
MPVCSKSGHKIHKILWDNENYDKMNFPVRKGVILCQVTLSGIP